jgi:MFS family permease
VSRRLAACVAAAFVLLAATAEERTLGTVTDEQQMLYTAISLATTGEIGISRNQRFSVPRPGGDAVSPYGMGLSLLEAPVAALAGPWEARFGVRTSQTLFVLLQVLLVTAAAAGAGLAAGALGAGDFGRGLAVFAAALASPLWAYTGTGFSEPLQAACLVFALVLASAAARAAPPRAARLAAAAGFAAGALVLAKGVNLVFAPLALLPLVFASPKPARLRAGAAAAAGAALPLGTWLAFEIVRFGRPLASYGDQRFSHSLLDGAWRLLLGPNKGLLLYFPLAALALVALVRALRARAVRVEAAAVLLLLAAFLAVYARWWAWDGTTGWGPRFLVPLVPLLAGAAGSAAVSRGGRVAAVALALVGVAVNALGTFQTEAATSAYVSSTGFAPVSPGLYAEYPRSFGPPPPANGVYRLPRPVPAASDPAFSPLRLHPFLLRARLPDVGEEDRRRILLAAPWHGADPDAVPDLPAPSSILTTRTPLLNYLISRFRWPHLFMSFTRPRGERPGTYSPTFYAGLADQALRNLDVGRPDRAARIADTLFGLLPSGYVAALRLEGLRLSGQDEAARAFEASLPERVLRAPPVVLVRALRARDRGQDDLASSLLGEAARGIRTRAILEALRLPPSRWPRGFRELSSEIADGGEDPGAAARPR